MYAIHKWFVQKSGYANVAVGLAVVYAPSATPLQAQAFTLVDNGAPRASIVVRQAVLAPAKDDLRAQKDAVAAQDLQQYIQKMSGATLPIVAAESNPTGALVLVGKSSLAEAMQVVIPSGVTPERREEGFVIVCRGDRLLLAGNDDGLYHGTEYATYDFLNRLGVRWFMPGEFGEVVPQQPTVKCADISVAEKPDFIQRDWWLHTTESMAVLERSWKIRNKMNPDYQFASPADSTLRNFVADASEASTHPELFAKKFDGTVNPFYPNLSNPATVQIAADKAKAYFRQHPDALSLGISPDDGMPRDFSPDTVKTNQGFPELVGREGVPAEMSTSEEWFTWINAVTREVNKEFPDRVITTTGYANRNTPPEGVAIDPHVSVDFAAIWADNLHAYDDPKAWQAVREGQMMQRWAQLNDKVWIYGYDYTMLVSALTPVPTTRKLARDFPLMKKWGVVGFANEARNVWIETGITTKYVRARLNWDANADVPALLSDFYDKWYGAAAAPAQAFWDDIESAIESSPYQGHEDRILPLIYSPELMRKLDAHLSQAERLANTQRDRLHVRIDRLIYQHLQAYMAMNAAEYAGNYAEAARQGEKMMELRGQMHAINSFLVMPNEKLPNGGTDYNSGVFYWTITDRIKYYRMLDDMTSGKTGTMVALLPERMEFRLDPNDEGRFAGWQRGGGADAKWTNILTTRPFYAQGYMDSTGHPYMGTFWYRVKVDVPASAQGRRVMLYAPVVECEAWCWVNGKYVGHRPYRESYERPNQMEIDVTDALRPGATNTITLRVSTSQNRTAAAGGLGARLFFYAPNPVAPGAQELPAKAG